MIGLSDMKHWAVAAFACGLAVSGPAAAQLAQNSDAPVDITADELEVVNTQCLAIYKGAKNADMAKETAKYLLQPEEWNKIATQAGGLILDAFGYPGSPKDLPNGVSFMQFGSGVRYGRADASHSEAAAG